MLSSEEIIEVIPSRVNLVDMEGMITHEWFLFFCDMYLSTASLAGSVNDIALISDGVSHESVGSNDANYAIGSIVDELTYRVDAVELSSPVPVTTVNREVYGFAQSLTEQGAVVSTDNYTVLFEVQSMTQGIDMQPDKFVALTPGNYSINYSLVTQGAGDIVTWVEVNNIGVDGSLATSTTSTNSVVVDNRVFIVLKSDDEVRVKWSASVSTLKIKGVAATATRPSSHSAKIEIRKIEQ